MNAFRLVPIALAVAALGFITPGCKKGSPVSMISSGGGGSVDGWSYSSGGLYFVAPDPGMIFGTLKTPSKMREFSYIILFRHGVTPSSKNLKIEQPSGSGGRYQDHKVSILDGLSINGTECKLVAEFRPDESTKRFAVESLSINGTNMDPGKGMLFLVDLTASPPSVKQVAVALPRDLSDVIDLNAAKSLGWTTIQQLKSSNLQVNAFLSN